MLPTMKRIIQRMLDFYRRLWQAFFIGSPALAGIAWLFKDYPLVFIILLILAFVCFVVALIGLWCDYLDARRKDKEEKREADRKALREVVKRLDPEYTEKQIDTWINGK